MRTTNPVLNDKVFAGVRGYGADAMTINGTVQKTAGLLFLLVCSAAYTWTVVRADGAAAAMPWAFGGAIAALVTIVIMCFKKAWSPILAPGYALLEGLFLGAISAIF